MHNILHSMVDTIEKANVITSREGKIFNLSSYSFFHFNYKSLNTSKQLQFFKNKCAMRSSRGIERLEAFEVWEDHIGALTIVVLEHWNNKHKG